MNTIDTETLKSSFLGEELDNDDLAALQGAMDVETVADGAVVVRAGDTDPRLFLLAEGRMEVLSGAGDDAERVYVMKPGEFAGTRAFVDGAERQATLRARGNVTLYALSPDRFEALLETRPHLVYKVMRALFRITHVNLMRMNSEARELANYVYKRGGRY